MSNRMPESSELTTNATKFTLDPLYVQRYDFQFKGLRPNTKHDLYMNGQLYNFAAKPFGKNLGDSIITDSTGSVRVIVLAEKNYRLPVSDKDASGALLDSSTKNQQKDKREKIVIRTYDDFQLVSADQKSSATIRKYLDSLVSN